MITAKEALDLYETSDAFIQPQYLDKLEADIRQAATAGKRELVCGIKKLTETVADTETAEPNSIQAKVMAELKRAKFRVEWTKVGEPVVPKALQDETGAGPLHATWGIQVSW
jgi:hypothetical protein